MTTGVILAGGHSERFADGDKALASLDGRPLIAHVAEPLAATCEELIVSCRAAQQQSLRGALKQHGYDPTIIVDTAIVGPLGGIRDGLQRADTEWSYVVGCDFPCLDTQTLDALAGEGDADAIVFSSPEGSQPLCGRYRTASTLSAAREVLSADSRRMSTLLSNLSVERYPIANQPFDVEARLKNINTLEDLQSLSAET